MPLLCPVSRIMAKKIPRNTVFTIPLGEWFEASERSRTVAHASGGHCSELQTHSGCVQGKLIVSLNSLNYPSTERGKSKVLFHPLCGLSQQCVFLLRSLLYPAAAHAAETIRAANAAAVTAPVPSASPVATDT